MTRFLPLLALPGLLLACGTKPELRRYTVEAQINDVPDWLNPQSAGVIHEVLPCNNAEVFDETIRVYEGLVPGAVAAIQIHWTGFDLSNGGENTETIFLQSGEVHPVVAALKPDLVLYEIDHKGRMFEVDKDAAKVRKKKSAEGEYTLGEGLPITEVHELADEVDDVIFIEEAPYNCDITQF